MKSIPKSLLYSVLLVSTLVGLSAIAVTLVQPTASLAQPLARDPIALLKEQSAVEQEGIFLYQFEDSEDETGVVSAAATERKAAKQQFVPISNDNETLKLEIPVEWNDIETGVWEENGRVLGQYIAASTDLASFYQDLSAPGVFFAASKVLIEQDRLTVDALLNREDQRVQGVDRECKRNAKVGYRDAFYLGGYSPYSLCRKNGKHLYLAIAAVPAHQTYLTLLRINFPDGAKKSTLKHLFDTFQVVGDPTMDDPHHDH